MDPLRTWNRRLALLLLAAACLANWGCSSSDDTVTGPFTYTLLYRVAAEYGFGGTARLDLVRFDDETGTEIEVSSFSNPNYWERAVQAETGDTYYLWAQGTLKNGRLSLEIQVQRSDGGLAVLSQSMPFNTALQEEVWQIEIPRDALP